MAEAGELLSPFQLRGRRFGRMQATQNVITRVTPAQMSASRTRCWGARGVGCEGMVLVRVAGLEPARGCPRLILSQILYSSQSAVSGQFAP